MTGQSKFGAYATLVAAWVSCAACGAPPEGETVTSAGGSGGTSERPPLGPPSPGCGTPPLQTGVFASQIQVSGQPREYWSVVPSTYDGTQPRPLVLNWHGQNGSAEDATTWLGVVGQVGVDAILVYPQSIASITWDERAGSMDMLLFEALMAQLLATYCIDTGRIFSIGDSAGAYFNTALGCRYPQSLTALANVAGLWTVAPTSGCAPLGWMFLLGEQDDQVELVNSRSVMLTATGCEDAPVPVTDVGVSGTCEDFENCSIGSTLRFCAYRGGHEWPADFAPRAIWTFFQKW